MTDHSFLIDSGYAADASAAMRYWSGALSSHLTQEEVGITTQREGFRLLELGTHRGVRLMLLDETTRMKTGTYKSLDGCISTALCRKLGYSLVAFSSGANAGSALTDYGIRAGLETFFFCPASNLFKIEGKLFDPQQAHLIAVEGTDRRVKEAARLFSEIMNVPLIPKLEWRLLASGIRGLFIAEKMRERQQRFDWFSQAICAGFGPIGMYGMLQSLVANDSISAEWIPRFLGVQQEGLSPIANAWSEQLSELQDPTSSPTSASIEPALYNTHPAQTYPLLYELLHKVNGDVVALSKQDFLTRVQDFLTLLNNTDISITTIHRNGNTEYLENAGLMAGAGALHAISKGRIQDGTTVLCSLTGGTAPAPTKTACQEFMIYQAKDLKEQVETYIRQISSVQSQSNHYSKTEGNAHPIQ